MKRVLLVLLSLALVAPAWADKRVDDAVAKAQDAIRKGKPDDAVKNMTKTAAQVNTAESWLALARIQRQVGQRDEAAASVTKATQVATAGADKALALAAAAELQYREGSGKEALAQAQAAVAAQETGASLAALARAQARAEDIAAATATIGKAMAAGAPTAMVHEANGDVLLAAGRGAEAADAYRKALAADATLVSARAGLANALLAQGNAAEAVKEARAATEADNNSVEAHTALGTALLASDAKLWSEAIGSAQQAVFLAPKNVAAQLAVARIFEAGGNYAQAANAYKNALGADPDYVPAMTGSIQMLSRQGKYDEALAQAKQLAAARPNSASANFLLGEMLARREQWADAATALEKAVAAGLNTAAVHAYLGTAYVNSRRTADAVKAYERALMVDANNIGYRTTYGLLLGMTNQEAKGVVELRKVVDNPAYKDADAWINLGWLYRSMEPINAPESIKAYTRALQIEATNAQAQLGLAWAQFYNKDYDAATASFLKAAQMDESLAAAGYSGAGWSSLLKKDVAKAKEYAGKTKDARLVENIDRFEKGQEIAANAAAAAAKAASQPAPVAVAETCDSATQLLLYGRDGGSRQRAAGRIKGLCGGAGVDTLVSALAQEKSSGVQGTIANAIGSYGTAGKKADVHLRQILEGLKCGEVIPTPACLEREKKNEPVIRAVTAAIRAVNGR